MNLGFLGNFYLKEKRRALESKFGNSGPLCPEEIFLKQSFLGGGGRERLCKEIQLFKNGLWNQRLWKSLKKSTKWLGINSSIWVTGYNIPPCATHCWVKADIACLVCANRCVFRFNGILEGSRIPPKEYLLHSALWGSQETTQNPTSFLLPGLKDFVYFSLCYIIWKSWRMKNNNGNNANNNIINTVYPMWSTLTHLGFTKREVQ